ncbi:MAG: hypothetical protein ACAI34_19575 [Verrucomicrobium sp.]|nr:hypothetical protein [Verrucomicrobium sp.]
MSHLLIIIGLLVFAYACRTFNNRYLAKAGWVAVLVATYLGAYFLTGSHAWGWFALALWFLFPWVEIVGRVRKLRFPLRSEVKSRFPPSREVFPDLDEITNEVEETGFEKTDDAGWKWEETDHFVRLFYHDEKKLQATISVALQEAFVFSHASLTTRTAKGDTLITTNYPFSFTMKLAPRQLMNRCDDAETFEDMLTSHEAFLERNGVTTANLAAQDPENLHTVIESDLVQQITHNLNAGVIVRTDEQHFRYSWRGCFFLWFQVVKDMLRV